MKKIILIISVMLVTMVSCKKEEAVKPNSLNKPQIGGNEMMHYFLNGTTEINFANYDITETTSLVQINANTVYVFGNDNDLLNWTNTSDKSFAQEIAYKCVEMARLRNIAIETGMINNDALSNIYMNQYNAEHNPNSDGSGFIWTQENYHGSVLNIVGKYYKLTSKFDNNTMSLQASALTVLCDYKWFGGEKWYIVLGQYSSLNQPQHYFNNRASSIF